MPFDDVCQIPNATQSFPSRWSGIFFTRIWRLRGFGEGPVPSLYRNLPHTRSGINKRDLENYPLEFPEFLHVAPTQWVMKKCRSDGCWKNCLCCTFCAIFVALLRFLCHFSLWRQKSHRCFVPSVSSVEHEKLQHLQLRTMKKIGCPQLTPHRDRGVLPVIFDP